MAQMYKYVNCNPFPIWLPDERGGSAQFHPGQSTTKAWFSRFVGFNQLTRMPVDDQVGVNLPPKELPLNETHTMPPQVTKIPAGVGDVTFPDQDTEEFVCKNGVYTCKLCDQFQTGSAASLKAHIAEFHKKPAVVEPPSPKLGEGDGEGEKTVVDSKESASTKTLKKEFTAEQTPPAAPPAPAEPEEPQEVFRCPYPGCGKEFTSNRGLSMHITRVHKE